MTKFPEIFAALAAPFDRDEIKFRKQAGRDLQYITARTAMNRLDTVLGPENWRDEYAETKEGLKCRLSIRIPGGDGEWIVKEDGGAGAGMPEADNEEKSAFSDAFKRAAVKFGVARYLYRDGVPDFTRPEASHGRPKAREPVREGPPARPPTARRNGRASHHEPSADAPAPAPASDPVGAWLTFATAAVGKALAGWRAEMDREGVEPDRREDLTNVHRLTNHLCSLAIEKGSVRAEAVEKADKPGVKDPNRVRRAVAWLYAKQPEAVEEKAREYFGKKRSELRVKLGLPDFDAEDAVAGVAWEDLPDEPGMRG